MHVKTNTAITALKAHAGWIERLPPGSPRRQSLDRDFRIVDIIEGCLCLVAGSPGSDLRRWLAHRPRRRRLAGGWQRRAESVWTQAGRKAVLELIELAIATLDASQAFRPEVYVGPLPVEEPRRRTDAELAALARGRETQKKQRQQASQRLAAHVGYPVSPHRTTSPSGSGVNRKTASI